MCDLQTNSFCSSHTSAVGLLDFETPAGNIAQEAQQQILEWLSDEEDELSTNDNYFESESSSRSSSGDEDGSEIQGDSNNPSHTDIDSDADLPSHSDQSAYPAPIVNTPRGCSSTSGSRSRPNMTETWHKIEP